MRVGAPRCTKWRAAVACRCAGTGRLPPGCGWVVLFRAAVALFYTWWSVLRHQGFRLACSVLCCAGRAAVICDMCRLTLLFMLDLTLLCHLTRPAQQDFMGFLHLGWESATFEDDGLCKPLAELSPLWAAVAQVGCWDAAACSCCSETIGSAWHSMAAAEPIKACAELRCTRLLPQVVDLSRPGLYTVQRVLGWHPLHVAAMSGAGCRCTGGCRGCCMLLRGSVVLQRATFCLCCCMHGPSNRLFVRSSGPRTASCLPTDALCRQH